MGDNGRRRQYRGELKKRTTANWSTGYTQAIYKQLYTTQDPKNWVEANPTSFITTRHNLTQNVQDF